MTTSLSGQEQSLILGMLVLSIFLFCVLWTANMLRTNTLASLIVSIVVVDLSAGL